eukprot:1432219-Amphidinium_carterae.1
MDRLFVCQALVEILSLLLVTITHVCQLPEQKANATNLFITYHFRTSQEPKVPKQKLKGSVMAIY